MFTHNDHLTFNKIAWNLDRAGTHINLVKTIGMFDMLNHVSTVMFATAKLNHSKALPSFSFSIRVGQPSIIQTQMAQCGIKSLIAMTPKNPTWDTRATAEDNDYYVDEFKLLLESFGIDHTEAFGMALNFPLADGCFILIDVSVEQARELLKDSQLSFIHLPAKGVAELVSCID